MTNIDYFNLCVGESKKEFHPDSKSYWMLWSIARSLACIADIVSGDTEDNDDD